MKVRRLIAHPGCTAALLTLAYVVLRLLGWGDAASILALVVAIFTVGSVFALMLIMPPIPKKRPNSLLTERLGWLWRFAVAAFVFCLAGVLSTYFAHEFNRQDSSIDPEVRLLTAAWEVGSAAAVLGGLIFTLWVAADLTRLGGVRRHRGVLVALRKLRLPAAGLLARWCAFVTNPWWVLLVVFVVLVPELELIIELGE